MRKKYFSLIVIPHTKAISKTFTVSKKAFHIGLGSAIVFLVLLVGFLIDYFSISVTRAKYRNLLSENQIQKKQIESNEQILKQMKTRMESFEQFVKKLSTIAGLKSSDLLKEVGIGGGDNTEVPEGYSPDPNPEGGPQIAPTSLQSLGLKAEILEKQFSSLLGFYENQTAMFASKPTIWPVRGILSSFYGMRDDPFTGKVQFHPGLDIAMDIGTPVVAPADGVVIQCAQEGNGGRTITISHATGITTKYLHLNKYLVKTGQRVKRGDVIGELGNSGRVRGPHLHYEVRINGRPVDPRGWILEE